MKICKQIWINKKLIPYCNNFIDANPSKTTTSINDYVTCSDCKILIKTEKDIFKQVLKQLSK